MNKPEILAPAGSIEGMKAALSAGADAVYIGGSRFGARAFAKNPDTEELVDAIRYVHLRNKRIYLTVNTLFKEQEIAALYDFLAPFYDVGLDAVIVQDVGAMRFIAREFPKLSIHASTQMTLTGPEGVPILEPYGVTRIVPARELSIAEIGNLVKKTDAEVEIFVHGALCYCYSGQCLLSSFIGGRSGNRGRCAQPCRMEYTVGKDKKYFLSPKDLCGLSELPDLIETGAASFKIEGRMKQPEYTAAVTDAYRRFTDLYFALGPKAYREKMRSDPEMLRKATDELADIYNRGGFTSGFFKQKNGPELMSVERPGHYGVAVGKVSEKGTGSATFINDKPLSPQDVLEFRKKQGSVEGIPGYYDFTRKEGAATGSTLFTKMLPKLTSQKGDAVFRMRNASLLAEIKQRFLDAELQMPIEGVFYAKAGAVCTLTLSLESVGPLPRKAFYQMPKKTVQVCAEGFLCEAAGKLPATEESVKKQLLRTGTEQFRFRELSVVLEDAVFLPNGLLNELRRNAMKQLECAVAELFERERTERKKDYVSKAVGDASQITGRETDISDDFEQKTYLDCLVSTPEQARAALESDRVHRIYLDFFAYTEEQMLAFAAENKTHGKELFLCLPRICRSETKERVRAFLSEHAEDAEGYLVRNLESMSLLSAYRVPTSKIVPDSCLYTMNSEAGHFYEELLGTENRNRTIPPELSQKEIAELGVNGKTLVAYGRVPLMVSRHCLRKNTTGCSPSDTNTPLELTDRCNEKLCCRTICRDCVNIIYSGKCLNLFGRTEELSKLQPYALRADFTIESGEEVARLLNSNFRHSENDSITGHFDKGIQ